MKRQRKVIRDAIDSVTNPAIERLLHRSGVKRISGEVYQEIRTIIKDVTERIVGNSITFMEASKRSTVSEADLRAGLEQIGIFLGAGLNPNANSRNLESCGSRGTSGINKSGGTGHRFRPGTKALMNIRYQQKHSDCLSIPLKSFNRLVREVGQNFTTDVRYAGGVINLLQLVVEDYIIALGVCAYDITLLAKRDTLQIKELALARKISKQLGSFGGV